MEIKTQQFINSPVVTVSFDASHDDWCLIQQSETWKRIENFFEVSGNRGSQMTLTEKVNLLETGSKGKMVQIYEEMADITLSMLKRNKEAGTILTEEEMQMISATMNLHNTIV